MSTPMPTTQHSGSSAWGGNGPTSSPEGDPVRVLAASEIAMGGPQIYDYLLPDGSVILNASPAALFSSDGRYFVSPQPSRSSWGLLIFERDTRLLYHCQVDNLWELDQVSASEIIGRNSPLTDNGAYRANIDTLKASARVEPLVAVADLWLPADYWRDVQQRRPVSDIRGPAGAPSVELRSWLPSTLRQHEDPLNLLHYPIAELWLAGEPSGLYLNQHRAELVWQADGQALACAASRGPEQPGGYWLWQHSSGWRELPANWQHKADEPYSSALQLVALDDQQLRLRMHWALPTLSYGRFGNLESFAHSPQAVVLSHGPSGEARIGTLPLPEVDLLLNLDTAQQQLQSAVLADGARATWQPLRTNAEGTLGAYRCQLGEWQLDGEWLLDHRVSDCGNYLALIAFAPAPALAHRVAIANVRTYQLEWLQGSFANAHLQGFVDGKLFLLRLLGRNRYEPPQFPGQGDAGLLRRFDQPLPAIEQAHDFVQPRDDWRLYYEQECIAHDGLAWTVRSQQRSATEAPCAFADGDFVLPSPRGNDHAWGFGFDTENSYQRENSKAARQGGYLLTASGCGVADLAPVMIWSEDGRYLALTRHINRYAESGLEQDTWRLLLLDTQDKTLRHYPDALGWMPYFESFHRELQFTSQRDEQNRRQHKHKLVLKDLLKAEAQPLQEREGRWLEAEQEGNKAYWQRLQVPSFT